MVEFCARVPTDLKVRGLTTKYLLKRAARGIVPDRIIDKRKIGFFNAAVGAWFRSQADGAISDYLLAPNPAIRGVARARTAVERLVAQHGRGSDPGASMPCSRSSCSRSGFRLPPARARRAEPERARVAVAR